MILLLAFLVATSVFTAVVFVGDIVLMGRRPVAPPSWDRLEGELTCLDRTGAMTRQGEG